jgi:hypothetical protein
LSSRVLGQFFGVPKGDFQATDSKGTGPIGGGSHHLKVMTACQSPRFFKICEIKSISKPHWIETYILLSQNMSTDDFKK